MSLSGTTELVKIISQIINEDHPIDLDYYIYLEDDSSVNYISYLNEGIFYFEFKDSTPFSMTYTFENGITGKILISPYKKAGTFDYTAKKID